VHLRKSSNDDIAFQDALTLPLFHIFAEAINQYSFFGFLGLGSALIFANLGAAYGTARSGVGICSIGILRSSLIFKSLIPGIMAGILGIYGLIVAVIYQGKSKFFHSHHRMARFDICKTIHTILASSSIEVALA